MITLTAVVAAGGLLLVWAGLEHVAAPGTAANGLGALLRIGPSRRNLLVVAMGSAETVVGGGVIAGLAWAFPWAREMLTAQAVLYLGFTGYLVARYLRHDRADCGCSRVGARVGMAGLVRAGTLGLASLAAAVAYPAIALPRVTPTGAHLTLLTAAGLLLCLLLYALPPAVDGLSRQIGTRRYG